MLLNETKTQCTSGYKWTNLNLFKAVTSGEVVYCGDFHTATHIKIDAN